MLILLASSNPHKLEEINAVFEHCRAAHGSHHGPAAGPPPGSPAGAPAAPGRAMPRLRWVTLADLDQTIAPPDEDEPTFELNALKKARYYAHAANMICLADDSGLEVDALAGEPGVRSARYANVDGPRSVVDPANNQLLLQRMAHLPIPMRSARFVCAMALVAPQPLVSARFQDLARNLPQAHHVPVPSDVLALVRGTVEGRILLPDETADPAQPWRGRGKHGFGYDPLFLITSKNRTTAELAPTEKNAISHRGQASRLLWDTLLTLPPTD